MLTATLGPAIERLSTTFESEQAYLDFFRAHPALTADWNDDIAAYARYDLTGAPGTCARKSSPTPYVRTVTTSWP